MLERRCFMSDRPEQSMDPLSQLLSLLKTESYVSGGVVLDPAQAVQWPAHDGVKCYAVVFGSCWLSVEGLAEPVRLTAGECYLLPPGPPFRLATDLTRKPVDFQTVRTEMISDIATKTHETSGCFLVGGHFLLAGRAARLLLHSLSPVVHVHRDADKKAMYWALERMAQEVRAPQPGSELIVQQLAFMLVIQALRLHADDSTTPRTGWLFALRDKKLSAAIACMHDAPGQGWTVETLATQVGMSRSAFAQHFSQTVGMAPAAYLTQWRMLLACDRLQQTDDSVLHIATSLGYESESAFRKAFKRVIGCTPGKFPAG
ncbi:AraC family transcriptional regulator [Pantoea ananatis]|nr:AraC family transcriptional regulator [Pantoea ananatis]PQL03594.1 AraC family transcriptional regulator [Pantoea ananatis]